jgi:hypothetical protein
VRSGEKYNRGRLDAGIRDQPEYQQKLRTEPEKRETKTYGPERLTLTSARPYGRGFFQCLRPRSLRKEVIQPQVLLRLPCYDFTPIMNHTLGRCLLAVSMQTSSTIHFRDVTGGVYKARERIHAIVLIRHY